MIETTLEDGIATVRLASPSTANALTPAAFAELSARIAELQQPGSGARVLVLTGSGKVFSAGANLDVLGDTDAKTLARDITDALLPLQRVLHDGRLPTVAAVNGAAVGGAVGLALLCDIVVAARSARFSMVFARLGLVPDTGLTHTLPRLVGEARARALLMTGADIGADEAAAIGMIHRCFDDETFAAQTQALAAQLAQLPSAGHRLTRGALATGRHSCLEAQMQHEARLQAERVLSDDFRAAMAAFAARRKA
ncbi:enoyl-CoA hydratase/isomerase family protein [Roseateles toxinivorans]|uniref:2-(1,2-epoxy-1,2-dihydrophenyl)acetyl-CoA isomerase n=1 Tax=Roseateles toxinivorans TaxID=270368 RepID=A0A4R6QFX8_9BURK|nr:enoyl-CoA hydratase/isomerase family protein [Roseateles toxinivorans]TDP60419.1 2-(1,2-epoxy-1,2-dihydrophenyl)acetyl-CoA isomerase [Roseateles toxinivorans]